MQQNNPHISIVIPAHNEELIIGACLTSLHQQTYTDGVEIIVVDNNSTDRTTAVAKEHGATVYFEPQKGVCAARQRGTEAARGSIIVSTDADTTFPTDWLENIVRAFRSGPEVTVVAGPCFFVNAPWWGKGYYGVFFYVIHVIHKFTGRLCYLAGSNTAFKKDAWSRYDTNLSRGGDEFALLKQLMEKPGKMLFLYHNVVHTSSRRLQKGFLYNLFVITKMRVWGHMQFICANTSAKNRTHK